MRLLFWVPGFDWHKRVGVLTLLRVFYHSCCCLARCLKPSIHLHKSPLCCPPSPFISGAPGSAFSLHARGFVCTCIPYPTTQRAVETPISHLPPVPPQKIVPPSFSEAGGSGYTSQFLTCQGNSPLIIGSAHCVCLQEEKCHVFLCGACNEKWPGVVQRHSNL